MRAPLPFRWVLGLVPPRWRDSVRRDLLEEAMRSGRGAVQTTIWLTIQAIAIGLSFRARSVADWWKMRPSWRRTVDRLDIDLRMAVRALARQPWSTATIVVTLALGLATSTAAFAVFNHVLFRPVPGVGDPGGLATVYFQPADRQPTYKSAPRAALEALRSADAFDALGSSDDAERPVVSRPGGDAAFVRVEFVTDRYLEALRVRPRAGRLLTDDDARAGRSVAVISERWWRREFHADASAIGHSITINGHPVVIVGVLADYAGWSAVRIGTTDIWTPIDTPLGKDAVSPDRVFTLVGRLRPGVTPAIAEQQLRAPFAPFASSLLNVMSRGTLSTAPGVPIVYPGLYEAGEELTRGSIARTYPFALGASGLLLLLACANTANLLLARTLQRRRDLAVRSAIGAGRWRLARGLLVEAALTVLAATGLAIVLARAFVGLLQGERVFNAGPALDIVSLDWRVLAFAAALGVLTTVLFGLVPAIVASRSSAPALAREGRTSTRTGRRLRATLVCVQLALAVTLLAGAALLVRSLQNLRGVDLGFDPGAVVTFSVNPFRLGYRGDRADALVRDTLDRLRGAGGIESVAFALPSPFWRGYVPASLKMQPIDSAAEHSVPTTAVSADYFQTLRIPVRAGRAFTDADSPKARSKEGVGIVNESLARQLFGAAPAVGQRVYLSQAARGWELDRTIEIVGVVGDTRSGVNLREANRPALYQPAGPTRGSTDFFVRSRMPSSEALAQVRTTMRQIDSNMPITAAGPLSDEIDRLIPEERMLALLVGGVALIAAILGVAGVHAVIAHGVTERTREFGIRLALGASRRTVSAGVLRGVAALAIAGLAGGLVIFAIASRVLESRLYGVSAMDPATLAAVSLLLAVAAIAGAWLPARRATRVDPSLALRAE